MCNKTPGSLGSHVLTQYAFIDHDFFYSSNCEFGKPVVFPVKLTLQLMCANLYVVDSNYCTRSNCKDAIV